MNLEASVDLPVQERRTTDLVPYEPGVSLREVAKGTLSRFLPGCVIGMGGLAAIFNVSVSGEVLSAVGGLLGFAGILTVGFGLGLVGLRRWLYPDSKVTGRKSFIAGLLSPLALFIAATFSQGLNAVQLPLVLTLVGVIMALGMYFAWLSPTPEEMRGDRYESDQPGELPEGSRRAI